jgi:hypothetical protein
MKKILFALSLTAAFGLMACGDDSSSSASDKEGAVENCKVSRDGDKVLVNVSFDGLSETVTMTIDAEGLITEVAKINGDISKADFDKACNEEKADEDNLSVDCDESAKTITVTYKDEDLKSVDDLETTSQAMCALVQDPEAAAELQKELEEAFEGLENAE